MRLKYLKCLKEIILKIENREMIKMIEKKKLEKDKEKIEFFLDNYILMKKYLNIRKKLIRKILSKNKSSYRADKAFFIFKELEKENYEMIK